MQVHEHTYTKETTFYNLYNYVKIRYDYMRVRVHELHCAIGTNQSVQLLLEQTFDEIMNEC